MKVAVVQIAMQIGGADLACLHMIRALQEAGHKVSLYTYVPVDWERIDKIFGVRIRPDQSMQIMQSIRAPGSSKIIFAPFNGEYIKRQVDLTFNFGGGLLVMPADLTYFQIWPLGANMLSEPFSGNAMMTRFVYERMYAWLEKFYANAVIANSHAVAKEIKRCYGKDSKVVYPPVNVENYEPWAKNYDRQDKVISLSRFAPEKNLELVPWIASKTKHIHYIIAGSRIRYKADTYESVMTAVAKNDVHDTVRVFQNVSEYDKIHLLTVSKVFLHLARNEPFGISIAEAMSAGLIPIVHKSGGQKEITPPEWQYEDYREVPALVEKSLKTWSPKLALELSASARRFSISRFSREIVALCEKRS